MGKLILVKHSQPEIRPDLPAAEWHLSEEGRRRSRALAARLAHYEPDAVFSSKEPKAFETATIVAGDLGASLELVDGLHEHERRNVGLLPGGEFEAAVKAFFEKPKELVLGEETAVQALGRFRNALDGVLENAPGESLVVATHGTVISLFVADCTGLDPYPLWSRLELPSYVVQSFPELQLLEVVEKPWD